MSHVREMTGEGRPQDNRPIQGGDTFFTLSRRITTPYPKQKGERFASQWLIDNAVAEAASRGDRYNERMFKNTTLLRNGELTMADRDGMLMYLFEYQPSVVATCAWLR